MTPRRPTLLMPLFLPNVEVAFRGWMGGAVYVQNLATVLSQLPEDERPRIVILTDGGLDAALPRTLFNLAAVEGIFEPSGKPLAVKPALAPYILAADGEPDPARITALFDEAAAIFPVLRSMFNPNKALHWIPDFQHRHLPGMFDAEEIKQRNSEFRIMTHKDHLTLFRAVALLRDRGIPAVVACTGRAIDVRHPAYTDELNAFIADNGLQDHVKLLGVVAPDILLNLFRHAAAIVQPSLFEGWSTVVEDAKAMGRPLFLTDLPVHREQAAEAGPNAAFHFYPPGDAAALAGAIAGAWSSLAPGPDPTAEARAETARRLRAQTSARAFVHIMRDMQAQS